MTEMKLKNNNKPGSISCYYRRNNTIFHTCICSHSPSYFHGISLMEVHCLLKYFTLQDGNEVMN